MSEVKKVYISVDIEGMEGVVTKHQIVRGGSDDSVARKRLALDVNAAVKACFDFGVEEVVVCDGHADMENIIIEDLDKRAKLISGAIRSSLQMEMIEDGFDAVIFFGHSGAGLNADANAGISHRFMIKGRTGGVLDYRDINKPVILRAQMIPFTVSTEINNLLLG